MSRRNRSLRKEQPYFQHNVVARELPLDCVMVTDSQEISALLDYVGLSLDNITAAMVLTGDGDYDAIWLCEDSRYYENTAIYHPLPYYDQPLGMAWTPDYWRPDNQFYR